uniref:Uncharacterized protein n=1 Tax=Rhizophora mucronata TaxID=61149 RepID=A0A2P2KJ43_RHIMU
MMELLASFHVLLILRQSC